MQESTAESTSLRRAQEYAKQIEPERYPTVIRYSVAINAYGQWDSRYVESTGYGVEYLGFASREVQLTIWRNDLAASGTAAYHDATKSLYMIDDGKSVRPFYVAGWSTAKDRRHILILSEFPTGPSHRDWRVAPARAFHVKVTEV